MPNNSIVVNNYSSFITLVFCTLMVGRTASAEMQKQCSASMDESESDSSFQRATMLIPLERLRQVGTEGYPERRSY